MEAKGKRAGTLLAAAALTAASASPAEATASDPLLFEPSTPWTLDYATDQCVLMRKFKHDDSEVTFGLTMSSRGALGFITVLASGLELTRELPEIAFGAEQKKFEVRSAYQFERPDGAKGFGMVIGLPHSDDGKVVEFQRMTIADGFEQDIRLELGSMSPALSAMEPCFDSLLVDWGYDPVAQNALTRRPVPKGNASRWLRTEDYPKDPLYRGQTTAVGIRLSVNEHGKADDCHITQSRGPEDFAKVVCAKLLQRARFDPALDSSGKPARTYWATLVPFYFW